MSQNNKEKRITQQITGNRSQLDDKSLTIPNQKLAEEVIESIVMSEMARGRISKDDIEDGSYLDKM